MIMTKEYQVLVSNESTEAPISGPGFQLEQYRIAANLSIEEVATRLCLRASVIEALEIDDYTNITRHVFARGYLRAYAKLLNMNPDVIITSFNQLNIKEITYEKNLWQGTKPSTSKESPVKWLVISVLACSATLAIMWWNSNSFIKKTNQVTTSKIQTLKVANELVDIDSIDQVTIKKGHR